MSESKFLSGLKAELNAEKVHTENGAIAYNTSGTALVDINFAVSELRGATLAKIEEMFSKAFFESPELAVRWLFFSRDIRQGLGERRLFRICFSWLVKTCPAAVKALIPLMSEFGRFDDLLVLHGTDVWNDVITFIHDQLHEDIAQCDAGKSVSLLAKWMPSCNTSSSTSCKLAKDIYHALGITEKQYRKMLSKLRKHIDVTEVKTSANAWDKIDYERVPSKANLKYKDAFLKHDEKRRREYLDAVQSGEAKINSATSFPCDIVAKYMSESWHERLKAVDPTLEAMWKALPDYMKDADDGNTICVADGSGSMTVAVNGSSFTALDVANSLAIYFAEHLTGQFKNKYITFSNRPQYVDFSNAHTLRNKLEIALQHNECASTNIEATFDLMLSTAVSNKLEQKDIPNILILSDMNFNAGVYVGDYESNDALMDAIAKKWAQHGYKLPRITYWNICGGIGRHGPIPMQMNSSGIALVSGFSPAIADMMFSQKTSPYEVLVDKLMTKRYDVVADAVKETLKSI